ncbi:MAG TPA: aldo/keto reductase [Bacteroidia bacterium]|nr:aldo/keto reductase [Bacteroidia bacterium]
MEYRRLGSSGLKVSEFSFGAWVTFGSQIEDKTATDCMKLAYDSGINFFDNAEVYANGRAETVMGNIFKKMGWDRTTYVVSSKVFWGGKLPNQRGLSRKHIMEACHAALNRLQVDYLDLYFCHRPDPETPIEETVRAMTDLVHQGKILYWGTSEWSGESIMEAYNLARRYNLVPPTMEQPQYNLLHRDKVEIEFASLYKEVGLGLTIWSPLASGILTGKYNNGIPKDSRLTQPSLSWLKDSISGEEGEKKLDKVKKLGQLASETGMSLNHLALLWCLNNINVSTVILGASKASQLKDNLGALEHKKLMTGEVIQKINEIMQ